MHRPYFDVLADLFYPQSCVRCMRRASDVLCRSCFEALPRIEPPVCGRCGMPTAFEVYGCDACRNKDFAFDGARGRRCATRAEGRRWYTRSSTGGTRASSRRSWHP